MTTGHLRTILQHIRRLAGAPCAAGLTDGRLLERFALSQDEAAFAALLERHGPMVLAVCRRVLHNLAGAPGAFQTTFLVFVSTTASPAQRGTRGTSVYRRAYHPARPRPA